VIEGQQIVDRFALLRSMRVALLPLVFREIWFSGAAVVVAALMMAVGVVSKGCRPGLRAWVAWEAEGSGEGVVGNIAGVAAAAAAADGQSFDRNSLRLGRRRLAAETSIVVAEVVEDVGVAEIVVVVEVGKGRMTKAAADCHSAGCYIAGRKVAGSEVALGIGREKERAAATESGPWAPEKTLVRALSWSWDSCLRLWLAEAGTTLLPSPLLLHLETAVGRVSAWYMAAAVAAHIAGVGKKSAD